MDYKELSRQLCDKDFCSRFLGELEKIFNLNMKCLDKEMNFWGFEDVEGTVGWATAIDRALTAVGKSHLWQVYNKLGWIDGKLVDQTISDYIKENIV